MWDEFLFIIIALWVVSTHIWFHDIIPKEITGEARSGM